VRSSTKLQKKRPQSSGKELNGVGSWPLREEEREGGSVAGEGSVVERKVEGDGGDGGDGAGEKQKGEQGDKREGEKKGGKMKRWSRKVWEKIG